MSLSPRWIRYIKKRKGTMNKEDNIKRYISYYKPWDDKNKTYKINICHHCHTPIEEDTKYFVYADGEDKEPNLYHVRCYYRCFPVGFGHT